MRILIADDDELSLRLLEKKLLDWKHVVFTASDGEIAWGILQDNEVDLVFSDWNMPLLDGPELCRRIRRSGDFAKYMHVILCTGRQQAKDRMKALDAGADDFLLKPVDFLELQVRLRGVERHLKLEGELARQNSELRELNWELSRVHDAIENDLDAAVAAQVEMLPSPILFPGVLNVDWLYVPARSLAGDMFGYFLTDGARLNFFHLDVAGHGISAALLSISVMKFLSPGHDDWKKSTCNIRAEGLSPVSIVEELNNKFLSEGERYFTICYGDLNLETGLVRLCQAGQPPPMRVTDSGVVYELASGFPVGLWHPMQYEETRLQLSPGEQLILYSDGITDSANAGGQRLGQQGWLEAVKDVRASNPNKLLQEIQRFLAQWNNGLDFEDDVSILRLQWLGPASAANGTPDPGKT